MARLEEPIPPLGEQKIDPSVTNGKSRWKHLKSRISQRRKPVLIRRMVRI